MPARGARAVGIVEQWERLLGFADEIRAFMKEHDSELKRKER